MQRHGIDALVTSSQANLTYLLDYPMMSSCMSEATVFAVLPVTPEAALTVVASRNSAAMVSEWAPAVDDVWLWGKYHVECPPEVALEELPDLPRRHARLLRDARSVDTAFDGLRDALRARGLLTGRIGFDEKGLPNPAFYDRVVTALRGAEVVPADHLFRRIRMVKTAEEIARMQRAAEISDEAWQAAAGAIREGATEDDLGEVYRQTVWRLGGRAVYVSINAGPNGCLATAEHGPTRVHPGEPIRFDLNVSYRNYYGDLARTGCLGAPTEKLRRYHRATAEGLAHAEARLQPGVKASAIFQLCQETIRAAGIPHFKRNHVGHALGVECYDLPLIGPTDDTPLEEGMVLNLEAPYYEIGFGAVHLEDTYVITATGARRFSRSGRDLLTV
jgi:Xaa-Pro dipeptidase